MINATIPTIMNPNVDAMRGDRGNGQIFQHDLARSERDTECAIT